MHLKTQNEIYLNLPEDKRFSSLIIIAFDFKEHYNTLSKKGLQKQT